MCKSHSMIGKTKKPTHAPLQLAPQTQSLLRLLVQVIVVDGHIFDTEIQALKRGVAKLGLTHQNGIALSETDIHDWFEAYKGEYKSEHSPLNNDVALTHLILDLSDLPNKKAVIAILIDICLADENYHKEEKTLISTIKAYWNL